MVGAIASQTAVKGLSAQDYRDDFMGRLSALAAAHDAAFQTEAGTDLATLITRLLEPYVDGAWGDVVTIERGASGRYSRAENSGARLRSARARDQCREAWRACRRRKDGCASPGPSRRRKHRDLPASALAGAGRSLVGTPASQGFGMKLIKATATELGGEAGAGLCAARPGSQNYGAAQLKLWHRSTAIIVKNIAEPINMRDLPHLDGAAR